jgi:serine/threonine-protein kinase
MVQPAVPAALAQLVDRCLARQPDQRPAAAELAHGLARWADAAGAPPLECSAGALPETAPTLAEAAGGGDDLSTY